MRKILFALVLILLVIFTGVVMYKGTAIADIWGATQLAEENNEIDNLNSKLGGLISVTYPEKIKTLENSTETLQETKKEYENQAILLANSKYYRQTEEYKLEFLWTRLGNYAKDNDVDIKIDVTNGEATGIYNLNFTITGRYSDVTQFIYEIENDSILGFRIDNFSMTGGSDLSVSGKFTCKDIRLDIKAIEGETQQATTTETTTNTTAGNTTTENTTNTTNTTDGVDTEQMMQEANAVNGNTVQ